MASFRSARLLIADKNTEGDDGGADLPAIKRVAVEEGSLESTVVAELETVSLALSGVGVPHCLDEDEFKSLLCSGTWAAVQLLRMPNNEFDSNAIAVFMGDKQVAWVCWRDARKLQPLWADNVARIMAVDKDMPHRLTIEASFCDLLAVDAARLRDAFQEPNDAIDYAWPPNDSYRLRSVDFDQANKRNRADPDDEEDVDLRWDARHPQGVLPPADLPPSPATAANFGVFDHNGNFADTGWAPFDPARVRAVDDFVRLLSWPEMLISGALAYLGLAPADDALWYAQFGLLPPGDWTVDGGIRLEGDGRPPAGEDVELIGAVHRVNNCWTPETLAAVDDLMGSKDFFAPHGFTFQARKRDQLIRVFGGAYVLGQKAGKDNLKLALGDAHTDLTRLLCQGKNIIYALTHLALPPAPGFNTLVFGLTWLGAGFGYHRDQVTEVPAKNVTMTPHQPVVTTVLYQRPADAGKEAVYFLPSSTVPRRARPSRYNWNARSYEEPYVARLAVATDNGTVHVQRSGLQEVAKHGVFHVPGQARRTGARVAITSRVSHADCLQRLVAGKYIDQNTLDMCYTEGAVGATSNGTYGQIIGPRGSVSVQWRRE